MKTVTITSGNFATGEGKKGNFTAYNVLGEKYFIHKRIMNSLGWTTDAEVKFPFHCCSAVRPIGQLNDDGTVMLDEFNNPVVIQREQITSVFKTQAELVQALVDTKSTDVLVQAGIKALGTAQGLDASMIAKLSTASI